MSSTATPKGAETSTPAADPLPAEDRAEADIFYVAETSGAAEDRPDTADQMPDAAEPLSADPDTIAPTPDPAPLSQPASSGMPDIAALLRAAAAEPDRAAAAIRAGEFSSDGSGDMGTIHRVMSRLQGDALTEAWGEMIALSGALWEAEKLEDSLRLMERAELTLPVPETFRERVSNSVFMARDLILVRRAEARFAEGDLEGARGIVRKVVKLNARELEQDLEIRHKARRRSRTIALGLGACSIAVLAALSIGGIFAVRDLMRDPPALDLPDLPSLAIVEELRRTPITRDPAPDITDLLSASRDNPAPEPSPAAPEARPAPIAAPTPGPTEPMAPVITAPDAPGLDASTPPSQAVEPEIVETPSLPAEPEGPARLEMPAPTVTPAPPADTAEPAPSGDDIAAEAIYNCALGQAASRRAIDIVLSGAAPEGARARVEAFVETVNAACVNLPVTQRAIDQVIAALPAADIEGIARNIVGR